MKTFLEFIEAAGTLSTGEVVRAKDAWKILAEYNKPWHFVNFSMTSGKLGLNPKFTHAISALATYGYKIKDVLAGNAPYATTFPYATIFSVNPDARPYIVDLGKVDEAISIAVAPIIQKMRDGGIGTLHLSGGSGKLLDNKYIQEISAAFNQAFPIISNLFMRIVNVARTKNWYVNITVDDFAKIPFASLISNFYGKEWYASNGSSLVAGSPLRKRRIFTELGLRGILAGGNWSGGRGTSHGIINNECIFFYPTDLKVLEEIQTHKGMMASGKLNRDIEPEWGTPEKNASINQNLRNL